MLITDIPPRVPVAFATSGTKTAPIPASGAALGYAAWASGFPDITMQPVASGGQAPQGPDFNGILYAITQWTRWYNAGGPIPFNSTFAIAVSGYPKGAVVTSGTFVGSWINNVDGNTTDPDSTAASGWISNGRIKLAANLNLYVATTGSDSNSGFGSGTPFLTLQKAWNTIINTFDLNGYSVIVNVANGTYTSGLVASGNVLGLGSGNNISFIGNAGSPSSCIISVANQHCITSSSGAVFYVSGFKLVASGTSGGSPASGLVVSSNASISILGSMEYGACAGFHMWAAPSGVIGNSGSSYTISGSAQVHMQVSQGTINQIGPLTVTLTGTPAFSGGFVATAVLGFCQAVSITWSGSATGSRYGANTNSVINTGSGGNINYFPGNSAGTTGTGGQYV